jgi:hypothetical protein
LYRITALTVSEVADFPDKITGNTFSPMKSSLASRKAKEPKGLLSSVTGLLAAFGSKRSSMGTVNSNATPVADIENGGVNKRESSSPHKKDVAPLDDPPAPRFYRGPFEAPLEDEEEKLSDIDSREDAPDPENPDQSMDFDQEEDGEDNQDGQVAPSPPHLPVSTEDSGRFLSKHEFVNKIKMLNRRKQWAETAIRRYGS